MAHKVETGSLEGVWIQGDSEAPASIGIELLDSSPGIVNVRVTGAQTGIVVSGTSAPLIASSKISNNLGPGIQIASAAKPRLDSNLIAANGNGTAGAPKPGIDVQEAARPVLKDNSIVDNAAEPIWIHGHTWQAADFQENFFGGLPLKKAVRLVDQPVVASAPTSSPAKKGHP
jgi:parallel beta-helix repeat protein